MVLSPKGGALARQLTPFRLGLGGRAGSGKQYLSWIHIDDEVDAIVHWGDARDSALILNQMREMGMEHPYFASDRSVSEEFLEIAGDNAEGVICGSPWNPRRQDPRLTRFRDAYRERFEAAGIMALLGSGFDPGVTNVFCAYAQKELFDEIDTIDILDCNGGDHGHPFATNFNPEINIREITQRGRYWENGEWVEIDAMSQSRMFDFPGVGERKAYLLYHEELESLVQNIRGLKRIRFWMTFGDEYITHLRVLQNVGMTGIEPIAFEGREIVPIQFLKALLPDPSSLGENYTGKTSIGCLIEGRKDGRARKVFIYNICDHEESWNEVRAQAVSYTTGVPTMVGAKMLLTKRWHGKGVFNIEEFDPEPFLEELAVRGLPWHVKEM